MRFSAVAVMIVLPAVLSLGGCSGPPTDGSRFHLPVFDAPDQWEPDLEQETAEQKPES